MCCGLETPVFRWRYDGFRIRLALNINQTYVITVNGIVDALEGATVGRVAIVTCRCTPDECRSVVWQTKGLACQTSYRLSARLRWSSVMFSWVRSSSSCLELTRYFPRREVQQQPIASSSSPSHSHVSIRPSPFCVRSVGRHQSRDDPSARVGSRHETTYV